MKRDGRLEAQILLLTELHERMREQTDHERKQTRDLLRELRVVTESLSDVVDVAARLDRALTRIETPQLVRGVEMARRVGLHPVTLRTMAERGEVPAYQTGDDAHWHYDPQEVVDAIKARGRGVAV